MSVLPLELYFQILGFVSPIINFFRFRRVCSEWNFMCESILKSKKICLSLLNNLIKINVFIVIRNWIESKTSTFKQELIIHEFDLFCHFSLTLNDIILMLNQMMTLPDSFNWESKVVNKSTYISESVEKSQTISQLKQKFKNHYFRFDTLTWMLNYSDDFSLHLEEPFLISGSKFVVIQGNNDKQFVILSSIK